MANLTIRNLGGAAKKKKYFKYVISCSGKNPLTIIKYSFDGKTETLISNETFLSYGGQFNDGFVKSEVVIVNNDTGLFRIWALKPYYKTHIENTINPAGVIADMYYTDSVGRSATIYIEVEQ